MRGRIRVRGFSLIEIMVVVAIGLIVMGIAVPSLMTTYRSYKMGGALRDVSNVISRTRMEAIRQNTPISTIYNVDWNNNQELGIDLNANGRLDLGEPFVIIPTGITLVEPNNAFGFFASVMSMGPGYLPQNLGIPDNFAVRFTQHGNAQSLAGGLGVQSGGQTVPIGVLFFQNTSGDWGALTVSPLGAVRTWRATRAQMLWHPS